MFGIETESSAPESIVRTVLSLGNGTGTPSGPSIAQLSAITESAVVVGDQDAWRVATASRGLKELTDHSHDTLHLNMATWRNGSAFGFDCRRYQKVAGSSPAVVIFLLFTCYPLSSAVRALGLWSEREHYFVQIHNLINANTLDTPHCCVAKNLTSIGQHKTHNDARI